MKSLLLALSLIMATQVFSSNAKNEFVVGINFEVLDSTGIVVEEEIDLGKLVRGQTSEVVSSVIINGSPNAEITMTLPPTRKIPVSINNDSNTIFNVDITSSHEPTFTTTDYTEIVNLTYSVTVPKNATAGKYRGEYTLRFTYS